MDELIEYAALPSVGDYTISINAVKKQQVYRLNDQARELVDSDFTVTIQIMAAIGDFAEMPSEDGVIRGSASVCFPHYNERKVEIFNEMWINLANIIYKQMEATNVATGHTGNDHPHH